MIDWLYQLLVGLDAIFIIFSLVLPSSGELGPTIKIFFSVFSMPISILLAFSSGAIEHITTALNSSNVFVSTDYIYTGGIPLIAFWFGIFILGMALSMFYAVQTADYRKKQAEDDITRVD